MKQYDFVKDPEKNGDDAIVVAHSPKRKLDLGWRLFCLLLALIFWIYVFNMHETDTSDTVTLKIDLVGVDALSANDDMMVYGMTKKTVVVTVKGTNRDLKEYSDADYKATVDVSNISTTGEHVLKINIKTPENTTIRFESSDPANVSIWADKKISSDILLKAVVVGAENKDHFDADASEKTIKVEGPKEVIDRISVAMIEVGGNLMNGQVINGVSVKFYDAMHKEIDSKDSLTYSAENLSVSISAITPDLEEEQ